MKAILADAEEEKYGRVLFFGFEPFLLGLNICYPIKIRTVSRDKRQIKSTC